MNRPFAALRKKQGALSSVMPQAQPDGFFLSAKKPRRGKTQTRMVRRTDSQRGDPTAVMPETQ